MMPTEEYDNKGELIYEKDFVLIADKKEKGKDTYVKTFDIQDEGYYGIIYNMEYKYFRFNCSYHADELSGEMILLLGNFFQDSTKGFLEASELKYPHEVILNEKLEVVGKYNRVNKK